MSVFCHFVRISPRLLLAGLSFLSTAASGCATRVTDPLFCPIHLPCTQSGNNTLLLSLLALQAPRSASPVVSIQNLRDRGIVESGFVIGTAAGGVGALLVEVRLDGGNWMARG